jgi:O-antigen/teichoic acid export membrane protein
VAAPTLIQRTGRAAFWNAVTFPLKALIGLAFTIVLARWFALEEVGVYSAAMGVVTSVVMFTALGIPTSLTKFLPEIEASAGAPAVVVLLRRAAAYRLLLVVLVLVLLNLWAAPLARWLDLGAEGVLILRLVSILIATRAVFDLCVRTLNAFFGQLRSNLLDLLQGMLDLVLALLAVTLGFTVGGIIGMVAVSSVIASLIAVRTTRRTLGELEPGDHGSAFVPADTAATHASVTSEHSRFAGFALFTYLFELSVYFSDKSFANPALAVILGPDDVAIFSYGFNLAFMSVGLMVASFRGVYRPMFAHLRARKSPEQLRRAFRAVSKAQLVVLLPAGIGLFVMVPDYIPLLYGGDFMPAVPIAQVFVLLMYSQTAFNLGMIWLSIDERYRIVSYNQSLLIVAAPFFLIVADRFGLVAAAFLFGGARLVVSVIGYLICRKDYGFRFPWAFAARVGAVAGVMGVTLWLVRRFVARGPVEAVGLTLLGAVIYVVGLRVARILGPEEIDLLDRSDVPGKRLVLAWLAPDR